MKEAVKMKGFINFIREQGVIGIAIAFIIGGGVLKLITAFVQDIISPIIALMFGNIDNLSNAYIQIGAAKIMWGNFVMVSIDFIILSFTVYMIFVILGLNKLDKKNN